ncbi:MAG: hypothetical protein K2N06_06395 [Oscillospiraceae bacterium]|nr:hypothetical protein [Oscillospiraceae bacterium]
MVFTFGKYTIDADVERTREYYKTAEFITDICDCDGCTNFEKATDVFPKPVRELFDKLGIDPKKAYDTCAIVSVENGAKILTDGLYLFFGTILKEEQLFEIIEVDDIPIKIADRNPAKIVDDYYVRFGLSGDDTAVMGVNFNVPWVLNKENTY